MKKIYLASFLSLFLGLLPTTESRAELLNQESSTARILRSVQPNSGRQSTTAEILRRASRPAANEDDEGREYPGPLETLSQAEIHGLVDHEPALARIKPDTQLGRPYESRPASLENGAGASDLRRAN